jgi:hypothetical protein
VSGRSLGLLAGVLCREKVNSGVRGVFMSLGEESREPEYPEGVPAGVLESCGGNVNSG